MQMRDQLLIDGEWVDARDGERFDVIDPADGSVLVRAAAGKAADVDRAVGAARACFESGAWCGANGLGRSAVLHKAAALIQENAAWLAQLETRDVGKPLF